MKRLRTFIIYAILIIIVFFGSNFAIKYIMNNMENDGKTCINSNNIRNDILEIDGEKRSNILIGGLFVYMLLY